MKVIRVALIGYGLAGKVFHSPLIAHTEGMRMAAIVTSNNERVSEAQKAFPQAEIFDSADKIFQSADRFDLVVIASPNKFHAPQAKACLENGIAVVVDKPFATTVNDCEELVELSRKNKTMLTVFHNRRWDNDFLTLKKLLDKGTLENVVRFESRFERYRPVVNPEKWRESGSTEDGGGLLFDLHSHLIDQALNLFGEAKNVYAEVSCVREGATADDDAFVALEFDSGVRAHLWANVVSAIRGPRFRVLALNGSYEKYGLDPQEDALREGKTPSSRDWGVEPVEMAGRIVTQHDGSTIDQKMVSEKGSYELFYQKVAEAIREGTPAPVDPADALNTMRVIEAARASAKRGATVAMSHVN